MADETVTTPFGHFLIDPADCIGSTLKAGTLWDGPGFLQPLAIEHAAFNTPGVTILDVGANIGSFTIWCAHRGAWRVVAVEPLPDTQRYLMANLDLNKAVCADRVIRLDLAAYDRRCEMECRDHRLHDLGGASVVPVDAAGWTLRPGAIGPLPAAPLDDFQWLFGERVSFIKIDAQGCDGAVLRGLLHTIERDHPAIVFEWEAALAQPHGYSLPATLAWLVDRGYRACEWPSQPNNYVAVWRGGSDG